MELNFSELDNMNMGNPYEEFDYNKDFEVEKNDSEKYWEQSNKKIEQTTKRKKVSFNDILSNMSLVVDKKGVLQFIKPNYNVEHSQYPEYEQPVQQYYPEMQQYNVEKQQAPPIEPSVKHSYIYNKYFKDYANANAPPPEKKIPKTIEEYNQMIYEERIKRIEQQKRIAEIKSTKLMFTTTPDNHVNNVNQRNIQASRNNLRKMSFW
jgi:hypothetical protein